MSGLAIKICLPPLTAGLLLFTAHANAAIDATIVNRDLETIFQTTAPQPSLAHADSSLDRRIQPLLIRQAGYLISTLKPWPGNNGALSMTESISNEHSIRPNARTINGLAMMVRTLPDDAFPTTLTRAMCRDKAIGMLKFILYTHGAGELKCADGRQWKDQWQSALWANSAGLGCWLLWDDLNPEMKWLAARMIADEADRFVGKIPPSQVENDTKAEENAWNSTVISLAACMFPHHPHHEKWTETAKLWGLSSFIRKADLQTSQTIDGIELSSAGLGPTIHDDYTLENHNRVHPDYMNTININLEQWMPYSWAGKPLPDAFTFNTKKVFATLKALTFPDAGYIYVNGQDWQLHRNCNWFRTYMLQAVLSDDTGAAMLGRRALDVAERMMDRTPNGGMFLPEEYQFPSTQMDLLEMYANIHLLILAYGEGAAPMPEQEYWDSLAGVTICQAGEYAVIRTGHSFASFSWGDQPMGMVIPLQKDLLWAPNERSLIGTMGGKGIKKEQPKVLAAHPRMIDSHFAVSGVLDRAGGAVNQRFAFVALNDGRAIYVDDLVVKKPVNDPLINLGTISVLNDRNWVYHDGTRDLFWSTRRHHGTSGKATFDVKDDSQKSQPWKFQSNWYNLDDCLGIVIPAAAGLQRYDNNQKIGNGRLEQLFQLNSLTEYNEPLKPSDKPYTWETLVFYPGQSRAETAMLGDKVKAKWPEPSICLLVLEDGVRLQIDLAHTAYDDGISISYPPGYRAPVKK